MSSRCLLRRCLSGPHELLRLSSNAARQLRRSQSRPAREPGLDRAEKHRVAVLRRILRLRIRPGHEQGIVRRRQSRPAHRCSHMMEGYKLQRQPARAQPRGHLSDAIDFRRRRIRWRPPGSRASIARHLHHSVVRKQQQGLRSASGLAPQMTVFRSLCTSLRSPRHGWGSNPLLGVQRPSQSTTAALPDVIRLLSRSALRSSPGLRPPAHA